MLWCRVIDGQALEDLSLVASLTQVIQSKSNKAGSSLEDDPAKQAFPIFVWVLRDFTLKLEDEQGKKITSNQYLEHCLKPQAGFSDAIVSKNHIRRLISESFRERECVTFVRPAEDENILRNLSDYSLDDLRPEFAKQVYLKAPCLPLTRLIDEKFSDKSRHWCPSKAGYGSNSKWRDVRDVSCLLHGGSKLWRGS